MLTSGCAPPLPEDWCLRGMEWVGRKVLERGFWKSGEEKKAELEVLEMVEGKALTNGTIEDDDGDDAPKTSLSGSGGELVSCWVRIIRCGVNIAGAVEGFNWVEGSREWNIEGKLAKKVTQWKEEDQAEREEEERRRMGRRWTEDPMDVDDTEEDDVSEASEDDEEDSEEVKSLKVSLFFVGGTRQLTVFSVSGSSEIFKEPPSISQARKCCRQFITTSTSFQSSCIEESHRLSSSINDHPRIHSACCRY